MELVSMYDDNSIGQGLKFGINSWTLILHDGRPEHTLSAKLCKKNILFLWVNYQERKYGLLQDMLIIPVGTAWNERSNLWLEYRRLTFRNKDHLHNLEIKKKNKIKKWCIFLPKFLCQICSYLLHQINLDLNIALQIQYIFILPLRHW